MALYYVHCLACAVGWTKEYRGVGACQHLLALTPAASWQVALSIESQRSHQHQPRAITLEESFKA